MKTLAVFILTLTVVSAYVVIGYVKPYSQKNRYVVHPGLDASIDEIEEWNTGYSTIFNVYFGPKPYVIGWMSETQFENIEVEGEEPQDGVEEEVEEEQKGKKKKDKDKKG